MFQLISYAIEGAAVVGATLFEQKRVINNLQHQLAAQEPRTNNTIMFHDEQQSQLRRRNDKEINVNINVVHHSESPHQTKVKAECLNLQNRNENDILSQNVLRHQESNRNETSTESIGENKTKSGFEKDIQKKIEAEPSKDNKIMFQNGIQNCSNRKELKNDKCVGGPGETSSYLEGNQMNEPGSSRENEENYRFKMNDRNQTVNWNSKEKSQYSLSNLTYDSQNEGSRRVYIRDKELHDSDPSRAHFVKRFQRDQITNQQSFGNRRHEHKQEFARPGDNENIKNKGQFESERNCNRDTRGFQKDARNEIGNIRGNRDSLNSSGMNNHHMATFHGNHHIQNRGEMNNFRGNQHNQNRGEVNNFPGNQHNQNPGGMNNFRGNQHNQNRGGINNFRGNQHNQHPRGINYFRGNQHNQNHGGMNNFRGNQQNQHFSRGNVEKQGNFQRGSSDYRSDQDQERSYQNGYQFRKGTSFIKPNFSRQENRPNSVQSDYQDNERNYSNIERPNSSQSDYLVGQRNVQFNKPNSQSNQASREDLSQNPKQRMNRNPHGFNRGHYNNFGNNRGFNKPNASYNHSQNHVPNRGNFRGHLRGSGSVNEFNPRFNSSVVNGCNPPETTNTGRQEGQSRRRNRRHAKILTFDGRKKMTDGGNNEDSKLVTKELPQDETQSEPEVDNIEEVNSDSEEEDEGSCVRKDNPFQVMAVDFMDGFPLEEEEAIRRNINLDEEVKELLLFGKEGDVVITKEPKTLRDMMVFMQKYPNATAVTIKD